MIKRLIFDIDGTLIKGINFSSHVTNALNRFGIDDLNKTKQFLLNIKEYEKVYNHYDKDFYLKFFSEKLSCQLDYNFLEIFFDELKRAIPSSSKRISNMLSSLKDYELVLLSNYFEESQRNRLTSMEINQYFSEYYGEKIIKPNIDAYISSAGLHKPSECVIIGDDKKLDIDIPKKLGFHTIYVSESGDIKNVEDLGVDLIRKIK